MTILIVEDDGPALRLLTAVLDRKGYVVVGETSAEEAGRQIKRRPPALVLLDLKLPGMDGLSFARKLKDDGETKHIPIIAITAATEKFSREDALAAGCHAFITKPIDTRMLPLTIKQILGGSLPGEPV